LNERSDFFCSRNALEWIDTPEIKSYVISIFLATFVITMLFRLAEVG
jgi:hypothetical protein